MSNNIRIYIADLAAYNGGNLHGVWIDATLELDDMQEQINTMLKSSPEPMAEEYAIHDYEGFEGVSLSEYEGLESVHDKALFIDEHGKLGAGVLSHFGDDLEDAEKALEDHYYGEFESVADYAQDLTEQTSEIPQHLIYYIDYEKMGRDMELSGDIYTIELGYQKIHIFWNH